MGVPADVRMCARVHVGVHVYIKDTGMRQSRSEHPLQGHDFPQQRDLTLKPPSERTPPMWFSVCVLASAFKVGLAT